MNSPLAPVARSATLAFTSDLSSAGRSRLAFADLREGARLWRLALSLGWLDIRLRYRGSVLGPFWLTISTGVMVGALGVLYAELFKMDISDYLPFLALSQVLWFFLSALVSDSCTSFTEVEPIVRSFRMPFSVFAIRTLIRNAAVLGHNLVVVIVVFAIFRIVPGWGLLLALPGLVVWAVDALALSLLLGAFCARFRDIQPMINSVMQIAFFLTPVIWKPDQLGAWARFLVLSPLFDVLEIVRGPLLGTGVSVEAWIGAVVYSLGLLVMSWMFFCRTRGRVAFWL